MLVFLHLFLPGVAGGQVAGGGAIADTVHLHAEAYTHGPFYGDLEAPGALQSAINLVSRKGQLILIHGNERRHRLLVNLVAQWNALGVAHVLLLAFDESLCTSLRVRNRIGCAHSSYLHHGPAADAISRRELAPNYVAWLQRFRYMRLLLELGVDVLAIDSDVAIRVNPLPLMLEQLSNFALVTTFDFKGGFANSNWYAN